MIYIICDNVVNSYFHPGCDEVETLLHKGELIFSTEWRKLQRTWEYHYII